MEGESSELKSLIKVWSTAFASLTFCYFVVRKIPKGILRLLFLLPIVSLFTYLPFLVSSIHSITIAMFFLAWLGNLKLLLFAFDQGPLSSDPSSSLLNFISIGCLPVQIKQENPTPEIPNKGFNSPFNYTLKVLFLAVLVKMYEYRPFLHPNIILALYCLNVYINVELVLATAAVPARVLFGFEIEPQFNDPYLSTSLQDFWGRRWNLMVTRIMRPTVYLPLRNMFTPIVGRSWALVVGSMATFVVSGLMHELLYLYLSRVRATWEVTWFFVLHGVCTSLEIVVKKKLGNRWMLHPVISGMLTIGFLGVTASWFFFPQAIRNELDLRVIAEYSLLLKLVMGLVHVQVQGTST